ncbi:polysaccharide deacetylase family protein [Proteinivorax hydrogeniformans]|uniref:Polysaccharide deacetylase family protein n=1 Tax=Proteinivorax hydrogeniformans TaxID=1826727 RepID=A0AAU8HNU5_9FIRM
MAIYIKTLRFKTLITVVLIKVFLILLIVGASFYSSVSTVNANVVFGDFNLGGVKKDEVENYLRSVASNYEREPKSAYIDPETQSLIPHLNGFELNIEKTAEKIINSSKGEKVIPYLNTIEPEKTIEDYADVPIYQGHPSKKMVSFVINVSWGTEYLLEMLDILKEHECKANFFLVGKWAEKNTQIVDKIQKQGHVIGNHGYSDPYMSKISDDKIIEEINKTNEAIYKATGKKANFFSPPYGEKEKRIFQVAHKEGMTNVLWSLDTIDWQRPGSENMSNRIIENIHNGAIILMHPTEQTPLALEMMIEGIKEKGYEIVHMDRMLCPDFQKEDITKIDQNF